MKCAAHVVPNYVKFFFRFRFVGLISAHFIKLKFFSYARVTFFENKCEHGHGNKSILWVSQSIFF